MGCRIAVVVKGYPRLSETFIAQELLALEEAGLSLLIVSLRHPTDTKRHAVHDEIRAPVLYLPEYLHEEPLRVLAGLGSAVRSGKLARILHMVWRDLVRDRTRNRMRRFGQALVLARELSDDISGIYAHYLHTPASVARYAARLRGLDFAVSAHAKDIWTIPNWEKAEKLRDAAWTTTCTRKGYEHLRSLAPDCELYCQPHGIDLERLPPPAPRPDRTGQEGGPAIELVTVARAVEKKGLDVLVEALSLLPPCLQWRWRHIGAGPLLPELRRLARRLGIEPRVEWLGALSHEGVVEALRRSDIFCLALRVAADGDRDGIPNVVAEAMSQGLPVVSADAGAVGELVEHEKSGLLVPCDDPTALSQAIVALADDPERRRRMGAVGRQVVETRFRAGPSQEQIARKLAELTSIRCSG